MNKVVKAMMTSIWPASAMVGADQAEADVLETSRSLVVALLVRLHPSFHTLQEILVSLTMTSLYLSLAFLFVDNARYWTGRTNPCLSMYAASLQPATCFSRKGCISTIHLTTHNTLDSRGLESHAHHLRLKTRINTTCTLVTKPCPIGQDQVITYVRIVHAC